MQRALASLASIALLAWLCFHAWVIVHLVQAEVVPALVLILAYGVTLSARYAIRGTHRLKSA